MFRLILLTIGLCQVLADTENVSINTERDLLSTDNEDANKRAPIHDMQDLIPLMFNRAPSSIFGGGEYSTKEQKKILAAHNDYRRGVSPSSSDMNEMLWSPKLAEQAQTWSDACVYEHPDKRQHTDYNGIGQNLYIKYLDTGGQNPPSPATEPVRLWYEEVSDFHYDQNVCNRGAVCGHFTQVVWAKTTKVGCGIKFCPTARSSRNTYQNAWLVVCNYSPAGNMMGDKPYKDGPQCSECENGFCMNDLCSKCKRTERGCECNIECQNCGKKVAKTCSCKCPDGFYGVNCGNPCEDTDPNCGANPGWPSFWCNDAQFPFVDQKCPKMCGICQAGSGRPRC